MMHGPDPFPHEYAYALTPDYNMKTFQT
jgi:hypothetical protein